MHGTWNELTADELVAPLVVVDIRHKVADDPNATVDPEDLVAWERGHGRIPERALVAMYSGWDVRAKGTTVFVGAIPWEDGSGGPCRVIATR